MSGDRQQDHGYRSIWRVMLQSPKRGKDAADEENKAYQNARWALNDSQHNLQFVKDKPYDKDTGTEIYENILDQYGLQHEEAKRPTRLPQLLTDEEKDEEKDDSEKDDSEAMPEELYPAEITVTKRFSRKAGATTPEAFFRRIRNALIKYGIDMSVKQLATYRRIFSRILYAVDSPLAQSETPVLKRAEFEGYIWTKIAGNVLEDVLLGQWSLGLVSGDDDTRTKLFYVVKTGGERTTSLIHAVRMQRDDEPDADGKFPAGCRIRVQETGRLFTDLWPTLKDNLGPLLDLTNKGHFRDEHPVHLCPGEELMSFAGFCAMQARFCGGDKEGLQLVMSLMSPDAFIQKHDWLADLLDNTVLSDLHQGPCHCGGTGLHTISTSTETEDDSLAVGDTRRGIGSSLTSCCSMTT